MGWSGSVCCHTAYASGAVQLRVPTTFRERVRASALARADAIGAFVMDVIADTEVALLETQRGKSPILKRSVIINGHKTSVSLEATVLARTEINRCREEGPSWASNRDDRCKQAAGQSLVRAAAVRAGEVPSGC